jgi:hypothetical protein
VLLLQSPSGFLHENTEKTMYYIVLIGTKTRDVVRMFGARGKWIAQQYRCETVGHAAVLVGKTFAPWATVVSDQ